MSSSRTDVSRVFKRSLKGKGSFKGVLREIEGCFKEFFVVSRVFERSSKRCFKGVSSVFQGSFKGVPSKYLWCFKEVSSVFLYNFKGVSKKFIGNYQRYFKDVSRKF